MPFGQPDHAACPVWDKGPVSPAVFFYIESPGELPNRQPGGERPTGGAERKARVLVLTRKSGESILIGNLIRVIVTEIRNGKVRIGIVAPDDVPVDREEVRRRRDEFIGVLAGPEIDSPPSLTVC